MNISILSRKKTMTIEEYMEDYRYRHSEYCPDTIFNIQRNEQLEKFTVTFLALVLFQAKMASAADIGSNIDVLGNRLLGIFRRLGYWTCILMCAYEVVRSISEGDAKDIGRVSVKYIVGYLMLYALPWVLDLIQEGFN